MESIIQQEGPMIYMIKLLSKPEKRDDLNSLERNPLESSYGYCKVDVCYSKIVLFALASCRI